MAEIKSKILPHHLLREIEQAERLAHSLGMWTTERALNRAKNAAMGDITKLQEVVSSEITT